MTPITWKTKDQACGILPWISDFNNRNQASPLTGGFEHPTASLLQAKSARIHLWAGGYFLLTTQIIL